MINLSKIINRLLDFLSKKIRMNIRHLISLIISKFYSNKVNENLIAFGSTNGNAFSGNSRDLFLYLNKNSNYKCVWFTSSEKILKDLNKNGYSTASNRKISEIFYSVKILKAAKYIFITHGFGDILLVDFSPETVVVHLDHGSALKRIGQALRDSFLNAFQKKVHNYWNKRISFLTVCSEETKRTKKYSYDLPPKRVIITGYPRNDILVNHTNEFKNQIKERLNINKESEIILYAPTFRDYKNENPLKKELLEKLEIILSKNGKTFLYKPHPFEDKIDLRKYKYIKSIDPNVDIRDLLVIADLLITDYSGVFYDFLLTLRPILFFPYDLERYADYRDFYYDYESFVPGPLVRSTEDLLLKLENINSWSQEYYEKRVNTRNLFNKYHDGNATERIIDIFNLKVNGKVVVSKKSAITPAEHKIGKIGLLFNNILENFSKLLGMNVKHLFSYLLSKLFSNKINDNLLVFGSTNGQAFAGNTKVVFEFLCEHSDYYCVWITASEKVYRDLRNQNYNAILNKDLIQTVKILKAAKYIFISHGFGDIFFIDFSPKSSLIHLAHGLSFKKGGHDLQESFMPFIEKMMNKKLVNLMSLLIDSSEETKKNKMTRFGIPTDRIVVTGYPRNDILINHTNELKNQIKNFLKINVSSEIILYAPTFRDYEYKTPLTEDFLIKLNNFLISENKIFLYKPHPFTENIDLNNYENMISIERNVDIMDLLIIADILITDYSSVFYDFLLTMRPIIFFADDLEKYITIRDFYYEYESFVPGPYIKTTDELLQILKNIEVWDKNFKEKRRIMRNQFNTYHDGKATERIINLLNLNVY